MIKPIRKILFMLAVAGFALAAAPARADLTLAGRGSATSLGMPSVGQETVYIKKTRLRRDVLERGKAYSFLYDLESRQVAVLDHSLRQAEVHAMTALAAEAKAEMSEKAIKLDVRPTGRSQALQTWTCAEHTLSAAMPAVLGNEPVVMQLAGVIWLARRVPEQDEVAAFVKAANAPDIFLGLPGMARTSPAQAVAISELIRRVAPMGMPCAVELDIRYEGTGRMAELARRMATRVGVSYQRFSTAGLPNELFSVPAGYRVVRK